MAAAGAGGRAVVRRVGFGFGQRNRGLGKLEGKVGRMVSDGVVQRRRD